MEANGLFHDPTALSSGKNSQYRLDGRLRGLWAGLGCAERRKIPCPEGNRTSAVEPLATELLRLPESGVWSAYAAVFNTLQPSGYYMYHLLQYTKAQNSAYRVLFVFRLVLTAISAFSLISINRFVFAMET
jgi:hypothetical protein